jgi:hypothetical protein
MDLYPMNNQWNHIHIHIHIHIHVHIRFDIHKKIEIWTVKSHSNSIMKKQKR